MKIGQFLNQEVEKFEKQNSGWFRRNYFLIGGGWISHEVDMRVAEHFQEHFPGLKGHGNIQGTVKASMIERLRKKYRVVNATKGMRKKHDKGL